MAAQLGLNGTMGVEWIAYVRGLKMGVITLDASPDVIRWYFDPVRGNISAKLAYLLFMHDVPESSVW